jgi:hypothetical protein
MKRHAKKSAWTASPMERGCIRSSRVADVRNSENMHDEYHLSPSKASVSWELNRSGVLLRAEAVIITSFTLVFNDLTGSVLDLIDIVAKHGDIRLSQCLGPRYRRPEREITPAPNRRFPGGNWTFIPARPPTTAYASVSSTSGGQHIMPALGRILYDRRTRPS